MGDFSAPFCPPVTNTPNIFVVRHLTLHRRNFKLSPWSKVLNECHLLYQKSVKIICLFFLILKVSKNLKFILHHSENKSWNLYYFSKIRYLIFSLGALDLRHGHSGSALCPAPSNPTLAVVQQGAGTWERLLPPRRISLESSKSPVPFMGMLLAFKLLSLVQWGTNSSRAGGASPH